MATGNSINLIHAAQSVLSYNTDVSSTDLSSSLVALVTKADEQVIQCKDLTITPPTTESEQVPLLGTSSTTAGNGIAATGVFQNALQDFKNTTNASISGTLALTLANDGSSAAMPDFINLATGDGQAISTTHHRHTFGDSTSGQSQVLTGGIFLVFDNGDRAGVALMVNPTVNLGDIKPTGTDGHWEIDFTANCLPCNFVLEVEDLD
jgi:hypothetical protein